MPRTQQEITHAVNKRQKQRDRRGRGLAAFWTVFFIIDIVAAYPAKWTHGRDWLAALEVLIGTFLAFMQTTNKDRPFAYDEDLAGTSVAFLALAALLPASPSIRTVPHVVVFGFGAVIELTMYVLYRRSKQGGETRERRHRRELTEEVRREVHPRPRNRAGLRLTLLKKLKRTK